MLEFTTTDVNAALSVAGAIVSEKGKRTVRKGHLGGSGQRAKPLCLGLLAWSRHLHRAASVLLYGIAFTTLLATPCNNVGKLNPFPLHPGDRVAGVLRD